MYDNDEDDYGQLFDDYQEPTQQPSNGNGQQNNQGYNNNSNQNNHQNNSGGGNGSQYGNRNNGGQSNSYGNNNHNGGNSNGGYQKGGYNNGQSGGYNKGGYNNNNGGGYQKNQGGYGGNNGGYQKGGYGGNKQKAPFDKQKWIEEMNRIEDPYMPFVVFFGWDADDATIERLIGVADKLLSCGYTVRFNADNPAIYNKLLSLSKNKTEDFAPLPNWEGLDIRFHKSSKTAENIAKMISPRWDNDKPKAKMTMTRNISMLFGGQQSRTKSRAIGIVLATPDGAQHKDEVNAGTGPHGKLVSVASKHKFMVMNINNQNFDNQLNQLLS